MAPPPCISGLLLFCLAQLTASVPLSNHVTTSSAPLTGLSYGVAFAHGASIAAQGGPGWAVLNGLSNVAIRSAQFANASNGVNQAYHQPTYGSRPDSSSTTRLFALLLVGLFSLILLSVCVGIVVVKAKERKEERKKERSEERQKLY
ncbi:MAG: hypothetical protein KVP17_005231 [Porospora cf. gigantea B]|uniref:uncharacterized protein n=1 Tax=Porospora cf. gigantea B TaxID=2853592 RepID=UPI00357192FD|nr:MAG: hypothetical protein KVP17_005231 [Porospora cf. gigantea B]